MAGDERLGSGFEDNNPLAMDEMLELLEAAAYPPSVSDAALLCRVESLLLRGTGATRVDAFLVNRWFNKLFHFSPAGGEDDKETTQKRRSEGDGGARATENTFETTAVCEIGAGVAGKAASTGRTIFVRDCSRQPLCEQDRGSLLCRPVPDLTSVEGEEDETAVMEVEEGENETTTGSDGSHSRQTGHGGNEDSTGDGGVLAVLQVYCEEGELAPAAMGYLRNIGRVLLPLLRGELAKRREQVQRCTAEALYSLSQIVPREMGLVAMVEEVVLAAEHLTGSERVCLFFVDDVTNELWVAKSVDFDDAKIKVGQGLCGHAAATGEVVNAIDSYEDSRFDSSWDKQTGFVTKSVLCVPIPPPDYESYARGQGARKRWSGGCQRCEVRDTGDHRRVPSGVPFSLMPQLSSESLARNGVPQVGGGGASRSLPSGGSKSSRPYNHHNHSPKHTKPMAVLEVMNKRGGGVFDEHEETALLRLCAEVECLLRRKAAEVALMKSRMTLRSCDRNGRSGDTASSNYARVESTIMRLYSDSFPADVNYGYRARGGFVSSPGSGGQGVFGGSGGSNCSVGGRSGFSPRNCAGSVEDMRSRRRGNEFAAPGSDGGSGNSIGIDSGSEEAQTNRCDGRDCSEKERPVSSMALELAGGAVGSGIRPSRTTNEGEAELIDWNLNMFERTSEQQLSLVERFFRSMGLTERFQITDEKLRSFVLSVEKRYHPNPFHNLTHAASVTHAAFTIVKTTSVNSVLRPLDKLGLLTAAFCHDIDHPGNNNDYEVNSLSPLALQHGDSAVLERHHVFITFQVLLEEGGANNILSELTRSEFREVRKMIVQAILATDMSQHMQHCADVSRFAQKAKGLRGHGGAVSSGASARSGQDGGGGGVGGGGVGPGVASAITKAPSPGRSMGRGGAASGSEGGHGAHSEKGERLRTSSRHHTTGGRSPEAHATKRSRVEEKTPPPPAPLTSSPRTHKIRGHGRGQARNEEVQDEDRSLFSSDRAEDRLFLTNTILHCADLSGQVLDIRLALEWGQRILEEFRTQADLEARAGLRLTTVASGDRETTMKGQHFFLARIVKPLWEPFVTIFPELDPLLTNLNRNCDYYHEEAKGCERQRLRADKAGGDVSGGGE